MNRKICLSLLLVTFLLSSLVHASDWPQFRGDMGRTAAAPHALPGNLKLSWTRSLPAPQPAFPHEMRLAYDASYEPVVFGKTMFVPSMITDSVTAFDTETGRKRWRFFAAGPVRFAPAVWQSKVFFVSDDGYLYCLDADDGSLCWKFSGLPADMRPRAVIGHGRLVSLYPARGGPVVADGVVYFAAGLWPTEGVFVHAVEAESGAVIWSNTDSDHIPASNWDHGVGQYSGLTPQGYLAVVDNRLIVPCGAQLPAFLDLKNGELLNYTMGWGGRNGLPKGCWFVAGAGKYLSHGGDLFDIRRPNKERLPNTNPGNADYKPLLYPGGWTRLDIEPASQRELDSFRQPVMTPTAMYYSDERDGSIVARDLSEVTLRKLTKADIPSHRSDDPYPDTVGGKFRDLWRFPSNLDVHIKAGSRIYLAGPGVVEAIETAGQQPKLAWRAEIKGTPQRMLAADEKLFVVTDAGRILAFAASTAGEATHHVESVAAKTPADRWTERASAVLAATGVRDGYALVLGIDTGRLVEELARQSKLHVIAIDKSSEKVHSLRHRLSDLGLYGTRASVLVGDPRRYPFPPYLASLVVSETSGATASLDQPDVAQAVFRALRPYGGVAYVSGRDADRGRIEHIVEHAKVLWGAEVKQAGESVLLVRSGPLPGAADWSHAEANAASTGASDDEFVRAPLAVLWFDAAHRWHKYPGQVQVRVAGGRVVLFEEGVLRASDAYTGRELWQVEVPLGVQPLSDPSARESVRYARHRQWGPGASLAPTTQLVALADAVYLSEGRRCLVFDPKTGQQIGRIDLPEGAGTPWSNLRVAADYLVGSSGPHVLCVHRHTGDLLWRFEAARAELSIALGRDRVFCAEVANLRRGEHPSRDGAMYALDIATGKRLWRMDGGSRLRYSPSLDMLVTARGFHRGSDGTPLPPASGTPESDFSVKGRGLPGAMPGFIAGNRLLTGDADSLLVYDLPSGQRNGETLSWARRGCTNTRASTHLLTTRYRANSAWIDLASGEISPLLGVRPGCSLNNNLYPANGVLSIPNLTAGCTCNYAPVSMACVPSSVVEAGPGR